MKETDVLMAVVLLWLGSAIPLRAQPSDDPRRYFESTKAQAEKGDAEAQLHLALLYSTGDGVSRDLSKATKWQRKAAEQGLPRAQFLLSQDYANGYGVKRDS